MELFKEKTAKSILISKSNECSKKVYEGDCLGIRICRPNRLESGRSSFIYSYDRISFLQYRQNPAPIPITVNTSPTDRYFTSRHSSAIISALSV